MTPKIYECIERVLEQFKRPFTMLEIGASRDYYSLQAAAKYPQSMFVMIDGNDSENPTAKTDLYKQCTKNNNLNNIILLNIPPSRFNFKRFAQCGHIDVVVALHIERFKTDQQEVLKNIIEIGEHIIIEAPLCDGHYMTFSYSNRQQGIWSRKTMRSYIA